MKFQLIDKEGFVWGLFPTKEIALSVVIHFVGFINIKLDIVEL